MRVSVNFHPSNIFVNKLIHHEARHLRCPSLVSEAEQHVAECGSDDAVRIGNGIWLVAGFRLGLIRQGNSAPDPFRKIASSWVLSLQQYTTTSSSSSSSTRVQYLTYAFVMFRFSLLLLFWLYLDSAASAFTTPSAERASTALSAERREFLAAAAAVAASATPLAANAIRDYENVGLLGGGETVDVNNANVRVYLKMPGLYPNVAGKIASNGPYKAVSDLYNIKGLSQAEKDLIKKYESRFVAKEPSADYVIDRINNGL